MKESLQLRKHKDDIRQEVKHLSKLNKTIRPEIYPVRKNTEKLCKEKCNKIQIE